MGKELNKMSSHEIRRRFDAVRMADAVNRIDGVPISRRARQLSIRLSNGDISEHDVIHALNAVHKKSPTGTAHARSVLAA